MRSWECNEMDGLADAESGAWSSRVRGWLLRAWDGLGTYISTLSVLSAWTSLSARSRIVWIEIKALPTIETCSTTKVFTAANDFPTTQVSSRRNQKLYHDQILRKNQVLL
jgi:hypothetical protein